ncbi:MAG: DUF542 domain-containing protein [Crocinitomicaceae bacterium]|nr:DUF542 domain-containing protein [Crocinitomicaceae bacterium]
MELNESTTVKEVISANILATDVFKKKGFDFCCGGNVSLKEVCAIKGISFISLKDQIIEVLSEKKTDYDYENWELDKLINHIEDCHHKYVEEVSMLLIDYSSKVARIHGHFYSSVKEVKRILRELVKELSVHMKKEELVFFPYINNLAEAKGINVHLEKPRFESSKNPIKVMEIEHTSALEAMKQISEITNNYATRKGVCNTFKALYAQLKEFHDNIYYIFI